MSKIDWKARFTNKATLTAIVLAVIALVYQVLGLIGVVPSISEDAVTQLSGMIINLGVLLGIIVDPNTPGITDQAKTEGKEVK